LIFGLKIYHLAALNLTVKIKIYYSADPFFFPFFFGGGWGREGGGWGRRYGGWGYGR
jgi:hypothetical protein